MSANPPTSIARVPARAFSAPPATQASKTLPPHACAAPCWALTASGSTVEWMRIVRSVRADAAMPAGPFMTDSTWLAAGTQMLTTSALAATSVADSAATAPRSTAAWTAAASRSNTCVVESVDRSRSAMAEPISPRPMYP